jgi:hypothetical protein
MKSNENYNFFLGSMVRSVVGLKGVALMIYIQSVSQSVCHISGGDLGGNFV